MLIVQMNVSLAKDFVQAPRARRNASKAVMRRYQINAFVRGGNRNKLKVRSVTECTKFAVAECSGLVLIDFVRVASSKFHLFASAQERKGNSFYLSLVIPVDNRQPEGGGPPQMFAMFGAKSCQLLPASPSVLSPLAPFFQ